MVTKKELEKEIKELYDDIGEEVNKVTSLHTENLKLKGQLERTSKIRDDYFGMMKVMTEQINIYRELLDLEAMSLYSESSCLIPDNERLYILTKQSIVDKLKGRELRL